MKKKTDLRKLLFITVFMSLIISGCVYAGGVENRINAIKNQFPSGTYFTANGQGCGHASGKTCSNCQLSSVLASKGIPFDSSKYSEGWTCFAFANYCFGTVFGQRYDRANGVVSSGIVTSNAGMYEAFKNAKIGDFLYFGSGNGEYWVHHYAIFISCDANGVTLYHNNIGGGGYVGKISYGYVPYSDLRGTGYGYNRVDIYRARNYDEIDGPTDTKKPTVEDVYIKDIDNSGYTVHCIVHDDVALGRVEFPTWTSIADSSGNTQDDIIWGSAGAIAGTGWELNYRVNYSDHKNNLNCVYYTDIYCYDAADNLTILMKMHGVFVSGKDHG
ncbi:MAG: hypothetical protein J5966_07970 [Lachnospiraceae bacterium]|nr:hypothetical protein [Lachnospiraceae bacterium]